MATSAPTQRRAESARERREAGAAVLEAEFGAVYRREYTPALRFAKRLLRDRHAAEDAVQIVFARYWEGYVESPPHVFRLDMPGHVHAAILRAVRNVCRDTRKARVRFRKNTPAVRSELIDQMRHSAPAPAAPTERELRVSMTVAYALDRLTWQRRDIWMAVQFDGLSYEEVGELFGISTSTVRQTVVKAYRQLREAMVERSIQEETLKLLGFDVGDDDADEYGEIDWTCTEEADDPET